MPKTRAAAGASAGIIEASWLALADAVEYGLDAVKAERAEKGEKRAAW
jgi:hypothetical protein